MTTDRVTTDDLAFAATWLLAFEGERGLPIAALDPAEDTEQDASLRRVAAYLRREQAARETAAEDRAIARRLAEQTGAPASDASIVRVVRRRRARIVAEARA